MKLKPNLKQKFGMASTLAAGALMLRINLYQALLAFGVLQLVSNLGFWLLAVSGKGAWGSFILPPFDLGVHGFAFLPGKLRVIDGRWKLLTYEQTSKAAILLDIATCVAQVHLGFDAGIGAPLTWGSVEWPTDLDTVWWHGGAMWSWRWTGAGTVTMNLNALRFNDPKIGPQTPLCRWR